MNSKYRVNFENILTTIGTETLPLRKQEQVTQVHAKFERLCDDLDEYISKKEDEW